MAKKWKRPKTAQKHEIRLNAEKTSQERANSASGGDGRAGFPIPHVTRLKNWPVFEPRHVISPYHRHFRQPPKTVHPEGWGLVRTSGAEEYARVLIVCKRVVLREHGKQC